tara:strand:- start:37855 stop:38730 length:876 start_codon:yes stop_codon:yes gene_type:complete
METKELLRKVRRIEIKTRGLSNQIFSGEYHSAFKGQGMTFSEVREYQPGDEIRKIDWNVTARMGHPYVKIFEEEREQTVMLLVDVSASENFGSNDVIKRNYITEICAVLAFSAIQNNDKIGVIFFSDKIEKFIPPKKGRGHTLHIIRDLLDFKAENKGTDIDLALRYFTGVIKKRSIAFLISDFISQPFEKSIKLANKKHDLVALRVQDPIENRFPKVGLVPLSDPETGEVFWADTSSEKFQSDYQTQLRQFEAEIERNFKTAGVDTALMPTNENYVQPLMKLFKKRETKR